MNKYKIMAAILAVSYIFTLCLFYRQYKDSQRRIKELEISVELRNSIISKK